MNQFVTGNEVFHATEAEAASNLFSNGVAMAMNGSHVPTKGMDAFEGLLTLRARDLRCRQWLRSLNWHRQTIEAFCNFDSLAAKSREADKEPVPQDGIFLRGFGKAFVLEHFIARPPKP